MANVEYMTLADARMADPVAFDRIIHNAVHAAADMVGKEVVLAAFSDKEFVMTKAA